MLKRATIEMVTFFQALYKQKKLNGMLKCQELEHIKKSLPQKASDKIWH